MAHLHNHSNNPASSNHIQKDDFLIFESPTKKISYQKKTQNDSTSSPSFRLGRSSSFSNLVLPESNSSINDQKSHNQSQSFHWSQKYVHFLERMHMTVLEALMPVEDENEFSRDRRLHALFNDLSCKVDSVVMDYFSEDKNIPQRYYLMLSHYYLEFPSKAENVLQACLHLWNSLHMPLLFALLFHEWLFIHGSNDEEFSIKRFSSFARGANKLFWLDLENGSKRFSFIWMFLWKGVLENEIRWKSLLKRKSLDAFDLVSKFYFYYWGSSDQLKRFVDMMSVRFAEHGNEIEKPAGHTKLNSPHMFANEVIRTMRLIKNESVLRHYLQCCRCFGTEIPLSGRKTLLRLGDLLSDLATPGYPLYPTRDIIQEARMTLNIIWPYGTFIREMIRFGFRLLRPISFLHWAEWRGAQIRSIIAFAWLWIIANITLILGKIPLLSRWIRRKGKKAQQDAFKAAQDSKRKVFISKKTLLTDKSTNGNKRVTFKTGNETKQEKKQNNEQKLSASTDLQSSTLSLERAQSSLEKAQSLETPSSLETRSSLDSQYHISSPSDVLSRIDAQNESENRITNQSTRAANVSPYKSKRRIMIESNSTLEDEKDASLTEAKSSNTSSTPHSTLSSTPPSSLSSTSPSSLSSTSPSSSSLSSSPTLSSISASLHRQSSSLDESDHHFTSDELSDDEHMFDSDDDYYDEEDDMIEDEEDFDDQLDPMELLKYLEYSQKFH